MPRYTQMNMPSSITRRQFGSALAGALGLAGVARGQSKPPNVLFVMADEVRGDAPGFMGHPVVKTPTLDALARGGVALRNCFTPASADAPARISALTGQYPSSHGVEANGDALRSGATLLPRLLAKKGYRTALVGDLEAPGRNLGDIFDSHQTFAGDYVAMLNEKYPALGGDPYQLADKIEAQAGELPWSNGATRLPAQDCPAGWAAAQSLEVAKQAKEGEPWFLFTSIPKAPDAFTAPFPWPRRYPPEQISLPALPPERPDPPSAEDRDADYITAGYEATLVQLLQVYYGGLSYLDEQIGVMVRGLRSLGQLDNTLIVITSSRGNMLGQLGRMGSGTPYDGSTHVPCIFHYPAGFEITGGVDRVTDTTCLAPTIMDLAGLDVPDGFASPSAKQILTVVGADWDDVAFQDLGYGAVRTTDWKLVEPRDHPTWTPQLFDLRNDPNETVNLYGEPEAADAQRKLAARLQGWEEKTSGPV